MTSRVRFLAAALAAAIALPHSATAQPEKLDPRVLVLPVEGKAGPELGDLAGAVDEALARGARKLTPNVARATATLGDTAVIVGCDPAEAPCRDAVAAALNVDQLLVSRISPSGADASVEVTAVTREAEPVTQTFVIHKATRAQDLAALEKQVPVMLEAGEAKKEPAFDANAGKQTDQEHKVEQPPPPPPAPPPPAPSNNLPLIVAGAGGALAVGGGVFWALAASTQSKIDDAPTSTSDDLEQLADLEDKARLRANVGNVLVGAGVLVAAGGVAWYFVSRRSASEESVHAGPVLVPGGAGIAIGGAW